MKKYFLLVFAVLLTASSCVPRKDLVYLQGNPVTKKDLRKINDEPYKLRVHDNILIEVRATDDGLVRMFRQTSSGGTNTNFVPYPIDRHGNIRIPVIGELNVLGYTAKEVRYKLEQKLKEELFKNEEDFFVNVQLEGIRYTIMGEVGAPGPKMINQNSVSIIDAITNAGDINVTGNRKNIEVLRFTPTGAKKFKIDLTKISAIDSEVFYIKPNDYINVMPLKQKSWGTGTTGLQSLTTIVSVFTLVTSTILIVRGL